MTMVVERQGLDWKRKIYLSTVRTKVIRRSGMTAEEPENIENENK